MPVLSPEERKTITLSPDEIAGAAKRVADGDRLTFQSLKNRNEVARLARTIHRVDPVKYTHKNQLYDPRYTVEGSDIPDRGLANDYKHYFASLYCLESSDRHYARGW